ncbi:MAG: SIR2 family protein, partial [Pirellulales bacterium]|nr:SIR2 family protein [Pirellulales bacterium]
MTVDGALPEPLASLVSLGDNERNLRLLVEQIKAPTGIIPFVGAGMSVPFGFPAWRPFLISQAPDSTTRQQIVELLDQGLYEETAEALLDALRANSLQDAIDHTFGAHRLPDPLPPAPIRQLPRLCSGPVLTTNFDPVLDEVFKSAGRPFDDRILGMKVDLLREVFLKDRHVLVKLHGDAADRTDRVLTWSEYEHAYGEREPLTAFLRFAMTRPLLFLGCSLEKDRTVRVLEELAGELHNRHADGLQMHFAILEKPADEATFADRKRRLSKLGIRPIWYPTGQHGRIEDLLAYLAHQSGRGPVFGAIPAEPPHYLHRSPELTQLRAVLLADTGVNVAITGRGQTVGVQGMGGVGKTVLAAALARDADVQRAYPDGVYWLTVGSRPNVLGLLNELAGCTPNDDGPLTTVAQAQTKLREALRGKRALFVLDDVWRVDDAVLRNVVSAPSRLLVTTRNREVLVGLEAQEVCIDVLSPDGALRMLADWAGESDPARLPAVAVDIVRECGFLPLALAMIGAMIRLRPTAWDDALELLRHRDLEEFRTRFPDYPYPDLLRAIAVGVDGLEEEDKRHYLDLAVFPEDEAIPEGPLEVLWGLSPARTRACMDRLVARSLATWQEKDGRRGILVHDLQYDYVRKVREKDLAPLHRRFLDGYRIRCPNGWPSGPDDGYFFDHLAGHLQEAGLKEGLDGLISDFSWLQRRLEVSRVTGLLADCRVSRDQKYIRFVSHAIQLSAHVLWHDKHQLASQLCGRLAHDDGPAAQAVLAGAIQYNATSWLQPLVPTLQAGGTQRFTLEGHVDSISAVAVCADRPWAVSASQDITLKIWDLETGECLRTLKGHQNPIWAVAVCADRPWAVSASWDKTLKVWDLETGECLRTLVGHHNQVMGVA